MKSANCIVLVGYLIFFVYPCNTNIPQEYSQTSIMNSCASWVAVYVEYRMVAKVEWEHMKATLDQGCNAPNA